MKAEKRWKNRGTAAMLLAVLLCMYCRIRGLGIELSLLILAAGMWFMWEGERAGRSAEQTDPRGSRV